AGAGVLHGRQHRRGRRVGQQDDRKGLSMTSLLPLAGEGLAPPVVLSGGAQRADEEKKKWLAPHSVATSSVPRKRSSAATPRCWLPPASWASWASWPATPR